MSFKRPEEAWYDWAFGYGMLGLMVGALITFLGVLATVIFNFKHLLSGGLVLFVVSLIVVVTCYIVDYKAQKKKTY